MLENSILRSIKSIIVVVVVWLVLYAFLIAIIDTIIGFISVTIAKAVIPIVTIKDKSITIGFI